MIFCSHGCYPCNARFVTSRPKGSVFNICLFLDVFCINILMLSMIKSSREETNIIYSLTNDFDQTI